MVCIGFDTVGNAPVSHAVWIYLICQEIFIHISLQSQNMLILTKLLVCRPFIPFLTFQEHPPVSVYNVNSANMY